MILCYVLRHLPRVFIVTIAAVKKSTNLVLGLMFEYDYFTIKQRSKHETLLVFVCVYGAILFTCFSDDLFVVIIDMHVT